MNPKVQILGYSVDNLTMAETVACVEEKIESRQFCQHVVLNASKVVLAAENDELKKIIDECEMINADGQSVVWAAKFLGKSLKERVAGIDLMYELLKLAEKKRYRVYFFGAKEEVLKKAIQNFKVRYPKLIIAGARNGYFSDKDNESIVQEMAASRADILFVGFSSPKKEYWLKGNMEKTQIPFCMGVGGSFDVAAGLTKRAPVLMQKTGLEWFYRLVQEPRRMWRRYLIGNIQFVLYVIKAKLQKNN